MKKILYLIILIIFSIRSYANEIEYTGYIQKVLVTPYGILAGELDKRSWYNPINSIYISKDLGNSWESVGLEDRGIQDLIFFENKIYATTFYDHKNECGLFVSENLGNTWAHLGPMLSTNHVDRDFKTIYLGTKDFGLWISQDEGKTWFQKIDEDPTQSDIKEVVSSENLTLVSTRSHVYKTQNNGDTFELIPKLENKSMYSINIEENIIYAGSTYNEGIYKSEDYGVTWIKLESYGDNSTYSVYAKGNELYSGKENYLEGIHELVFSTDYGNTWNTLGTFPNRITSITKVTTDKEYLFITILNNGIYKVELPKIDFENDPFLNIPWLTGNKNDLIDKVSAFFDHSYPLLGYSYYKEPYEEKSTTLNFLGIKEYEPTIYYSSHSGTDFALPYGTDIVAPESGLATYFTCDGCGNSIRIDHNNGISTIYMHLQKEYLCTNSVKFLNKGDVVGKVGMTGNTTGPHLHFETIISSGNFPDRRMDPFGWLSEKEDPWNNYAWTDILGGHVGSESKYLWNYSIPQTTQYIFSEENISNISIENIVINTTPSTSERNFSINFQLFKRPNIKEEQRDLKYIENTSFLINAFDITNSSLEYFTNPIEICIDFSQSSLENILLNTIKLYFLNEKTGFWEQLNTIVDLDNLKLKGYTDHLSKFAVFGEKIDSSYPTTNINIEEIKENDWSIEYPTVSFQTNEENTQIFYSLDDGNNWEIFNTPFQIDKDGIVTILYRSMDENNNLEETQTYNLKINTQNKRVDKVKILNSGFSIE